MPGQSSTDEFPPIPSKRYFTIGEVSRLCGVKPHVLRYWEQEFSQLEPDKRAGNRRYYRHQDVLLVREIRALLYDQGLTINGARQYLSREQSQPVVSRHRQIIHQLRHELEDVLQTLKG